MSQSDVLSYLESHEDGTITEMSKCFGVSRSSVGYALKKLKEQGYVDFEWKKMGRGSLKMKVWRMVRRP